MFKLTKGWQFRFSATIVVYFAGFFAVLLMFYWAGSQVDPDRYRASSNAGIPILLLVISGSILTANRWTTRACLLLGGIAGIVNGVITSLVAIG